MSCLIVGISDCRVSGDPDVSIVTYALGSCIAVMLYDPVRKIGGMLHYMLPESTLDAAKAAAKPCMFGDTGIPKLLEELRRQGADAKKLVIRLAGGAHILDRQNVFEIGKRNYLAAKKGLWKLGLFVTSEAVGGELSRTVRLEISTGKCWLREGGKPEAEFAEARPAPLAGSSGPMQASSISRPAPVVAGLAASISSKGGGVWRSAF